MPLRVLVVDDHPAILQGVVGWISRSGVAEVVATTSDPHEAIRLWDELDPDVTLCDAHMPGVDGLELCRRIVDAHHDAVVFVFSARDDAVLRDASLAAGARGLVSKTVSSAELGTILTAATGSVPNTPPPTP